MSSAAASVADDPTRRACDQCRLRKIRCDKDWPCANCRIAKRTCTSTGAGQRPKEARQRVLISSQYEKKIDQIESRLGSIETLLRNLTMQSGAPSISEPFTTKNSLDTPQSSASGHAVTSTAEYESSDHDSEYGGDTALHSQANFASEFLEHAVERTSLSDINPKMNEALSTLKQLVQLGNQRSISHGPRFPLQRPVPQGGVTKLSLPPQHIVTALLKENKQAPLNLYHVICALADVQDFHGMVRDVYFATEDFSEAAFTIVNAGLYMLFVEVLAYGSNVASKPEFENCLQICRANLETSLLHTPLFLSTKTENVQALYLGALYAIDVCRPSVAWQLVSLAAQLCQTGGYHREDCIKSDPPTVARTKTLIFWQVYTLDKSLSLRLGRASSIADYDISIPRGFNLHGLIPVGANADYAGLWLKIAEVQGRIYEQLYSPSALKSPSEELIQRARVLAAECQNMEDEAKVTREYTSEFFKVSHRSELLELFIKGDELQFLATWCLVQRVIPAPQGSVSRFNEDCVATARKAMALHQDCIQLFKLGNHVQSIYIHWNLMLTPFAPFFILFCYVIETSSAEDLAILQTFTATFDVAREASEASQKFATLCRVMCEVVTLYVEAKSQQNDDQNMRPIGDEFEMYLSQLGFMPNMATADPGNAVMGDPSSQMPGAQQGALVSDWYSGSMNMMGLVEEDLSGMGMGFQMPMGGGGGGGGGNMGGMGGMGGMGPNMGMQ